MADTVRKIRNMLGLNFGQLGVAAVDFGTGNIRFMTPLQDGTLHEDIEPNCILVEKHTGQFLAYGTAAARMIGREPNGLKVRFVLREGQVKDSDEMVAIIQYIAGKIRNRFWQNEVGKQIAGLYFKRLAVSVPCELTDVQRRAVIEAGGKLAEELFIFEQPVAAAVEQGFKANSTTAWMVVDIGAGTTCIAAFTGSGMVFPARSIPVGGNSMDEAIRLHVNRTQHVRISSHTARLFKEQIGCAIQPPKLEKTWIRCRVSGKAVKIHPQLIFEALQPQIHQIVKLVTGVVQDGLEREDVFKDIYSNGTILAGCGALLGKHPDVAGYGIKALFEEEFPDSNPMMAKAPAEFAVLRGTYKMMQDESYHHFSLVGDKKKKDYSGLEYRQEPVPEKKTDLAVA